MIEALMAQEDWGALERAVHETIPERSPLLNRLGSFFQRAGLVQEAVDAFCKVPHLTAFFLACPLPPPRLQSRSCAAGSSSALKINIPR